MKEFAVPSLDDRRERGQFLRLGGIRFPGVGLDIMATTAGANRNGRR
jgi:hypothetical protein